MEILTDCNVFQPRSQLLLQPDTKETAPIISVTASCSRVEQEWEEVVVSRCEVWKSYILATRIYAKI